MSKATNPNSDRTLNYGLDGFQKRSGLIVPFRKEKIEKAVQRAVDTVSKTLEAPLSEDIARRTANRVVDQLNRPGSEYYVYPDSEGRRVPRIEDVQDLVEILLAESGETMVVATYKRYRKKRELARKRIRVRGQAERSGVDVTDATLLLVESPSENMTLPWDRRRIIKQIMERTELSPEIATSVAKSVENWVITNNMKTINTTLVRELVNNELAERGYQRQLRDLSLYGAPKDFVDRLMFSKSTENSNIVNNNPEAVNLGVAELILKQWALDTIFSADVKRAHHTGAIHLHDLGYPHRVYCSSHSVEYIKKYGLQGLINLNTESRPARSASVLTGHLNTFLASMQANYAGALGLAHINIMYAPLLENKEWKEYKQIAQELVYNGAQNAFSRGGQTLFLDFNIHAGVPGYLKNVPAIGPGGKYMLRKQDGTKVPLEEVKRIEVDPSGYQLMDLYLNEGSVRRLVMRETVSKDGEIMRDAEIEDELKQFGESIVTYGEYACETQLFCKALLEVWEEGDCHGRVFEFPKCDFHLSRETFEDPEQHKLFMQACKLAGTNGSTYFVFDRDEVTLSACCRLRTTVESDRMLKHPECMRFCGFQNVTVNVPQAAYRAARNGSRDILDSFLDELDNTMELVATAHIEKKNRIGEMISEPGKPLWQIGRTSCDGKPYVDLDTCTYIIGLIGLNDAVNFLIGRQLHESKEAAQLGLRIVAHMYMKTKQLTRKYGMKFTLEESPAESAARRLAKTDLVYYKKEAGDIVKGENEDIAYYTNSIHLAPDADTPLVGRIREQAKYHSLIESGAITHAFVGEEKPSAQSIAKVIKEVFFRTQSAQLTISPEFTYCNNCYHQMRGLLEKCARCGSQDVFGETRVVGYFSKIENWNKSKRYGELKDRHKGRYTLATARGKQVKRKVSACSGD
ncbi:MAG: anaerobic ribonucleoside-triphosphate reductase [Verrucomicrobiota bacterium]